MQIIKKSNEPMRPNEVIILEGLNFGKLHDFYKEKYVSQVFLYNVNQYDIQSMYHVLGKIREKLGPHGNVYNLKFYLFFDNFNSLFSNKELNKLEIINYIENNYLKDTNISLIIGE